MTISFNSNEVQRPVHWTQIGFLAIAVLFNLCLVAQLLTVGLAVFYSPNWWSIHVGLVRGYSGLALLLLGWVFISPFPRKIQMLTVGLTALLILQFTTIHLNRFLPLNVLHPLIGFALFNCSTTLVHRVWRMVFDKSDDVISVEPVSSILIEE
jgi:hypothetical protein